MNLSQELVKIILEKLELPFSQKDGKGGLKFYDYNSGKELKNYEGPFSKGGKDKVILYTWIEDGERNIGSEKQYKNRGK